MQTANAPQQDVVKFAAFLHQTKDLFPPIYLHWKFDELDFFPSLKPTGYFFQFKLIFFSSFMARVKYFDGPCLTIYSLSTIYRD